MGSGEEIIGELCHLVFTLISIMVPCLADTGSMASTVPELF